MSDDVVDGQRPEEGIVEWLATRRPTSSDPEADALATCFRALTPLSPDARARVLDYLVARNWTATSWPKRDDKERA